MDLPDIGRYRRRFIVEFGPEDSGLIDRMGLAYRTKRGAIIAGLHLLESGELEQLRSRVAGLEQQLTMAQQARSAAPRTTATSARTQGKLQADLEAERSAHRQTQKALDQSQATLTDAQAALTRARQEIVGLRAEQARLTALLPRMAYCRECATLVPEAEWAEHSTATGIDVYHTAHAYREKRSYRPGTTPLFQRAKSAQAAR
jgi:lauroyl/myristoyl acyltransferase